MLLLPVPGSLSLTASASASPPMPRPLTLDDLPEVERLLCAGFPDRSPAFWRQGLARMLAQDGQGGARFPWGFGLESAGRLVGVALTPASERRRADGSARTLVNLAGWMIEPDHRFRALAMLRRMLADPEIAYIDLTPSSAVQRMLPHVGLQRVAAATAVLLLPGHAAGLSRGARLRQLSSGQAPAFGPSAALLDAHRALGCEPLLLQHAGGEDLLVWRRTTLRGLPSAQLVYVQSHAALLRHLPVLARHLLGQGRLLLQCDSRIAGPDRWHTFYRPYGAWYARGADFSDHTDFLGSERCLFGV